MDTRVLELIKNPEQFQPKDLDLLNTEVEKYPYLQSLRALQLYGIHRFNPENYHQKLSETAAYTTDKKILYRLINKTEKEKANAVPDIEMAKSKSSEEKKSPQRKSDFPIAREAESFSKEKMIDGKAVSELEIVSDKPAPLNFQETQDIVPEAEVSPIAASQESGVNQFSSLDDSETFSKEIEIDERVISVEHEIIENPVQLSFSGTDEFLSSVKIPAGNPTLEHFEKPKSTPNKHEIEMQRLIAEVEAKMKSAQKDRKTTEQKEASEQQNFDVNFAQTEAFVIGKQAEIENQKPIQQEEKPSEKHGENEYHKVENSSKTEGFQPEIDGIKGKATKIHQKPIPSESKEWKPMSFSGNTPDSLIPKTRNEEPQKLETVESKTDDSSIEISSENNEPPVINASFFSENVSPIETDKNEVSEQSNIPVFINTWQNWLKIDRNQSKTEEKTAISITEIKNKVIDQFIENEPKISKLKEDSSFVVKEKSDDISHLMTETLAKLYIEQKLYSKAVKAYEILSNKFPEKKSHFEDKIKEIKELRQSK
ncbi:hypothetical protein [Chryseobacterium sp. R2A-55]|uniref:hypothetical protein n=1 Tax=Chryseobacterium sp. R2A-55 TaxID=2744445 RepID=UPI001F246E92|nr:hypothetical protein [Chryseobacterium sp. R2A-55]